MVKIMFETLFRSEILIPILWASFTAFATWCFTSAKKCAPLTLTEVRILWKIHKQNVQCKGKKWRKIVHKNRIIGFECGCGYKHVQKRPII